MANRSKSSLATKAILEQRGQITDQYIPLGLITRSPDGEIVSETGGTFDTHNRIFEDGRVSDHIEFQLIPDQVDPFNSYLAWLEVQIKARGIPGLSWGDAFRKAWEGDTPLYGIHLYGGRQGGKTRLSLWMLIHTCIAIPRSRAVAVAPTGKRYDELIIALMEHIPEEWCRWKSSEKRFEFLNGSVIELHSASVQNLKVGKAIITLVNEAQEVSRKIAQADARGNMTATSGLILYAYNPPRTTKGLWLTQEWLKIQNDEIPTIEAHFVNSVNNPYADHEYLASIGDPDSSEYKREVLGDMTVPLDDIVFPQFSDANVIPIIPSAWTDVTGQISKKYYGLEAPWVGGVDFDQLAGCSWIIGRWYLEDETDDLGDATFVIHNGHREHGYIERELSNRILAIRDDVGRLAFKTMSDVIWVADASSKWQNTARDKGMPSSWPQLTSRGWNLTSPQVDKNNNPNRLTRYDQARKGLRNLRVLVMTAATEVQKCISNHPLHNVGTKEDKQKDDHAHVNDAWGYCYYRKLDAELSPELESPAEWSSPLELV